MRREFPQLTADRAKNLLRYDPETGLFYWRVTKANAVEGSIAGCDKGGGRVVIRIDGRLYPAARIAWLIMTGTWPAHLVDHRNLIPSDNRWGNLREATPGQNNANCQIRKHNKSGFKGVIWNKQCQRWQARIRKDGKARHLGLFDTPEEAHARYIEAAKALYGEFARAA